MTAGELLKIINALGGQKIRQSGSHARIQAGSFFTTIPMHKGHDLGPGLLRAIERDLEPVFGKGWIKRNK